MEKTLTVGRTYAVTTSTVCDVTDANGTLLTTAENGQQSLFVATTSTVSFSDSSASVVAVFKGAPSALGLLGGGNTTPLPQGYTRAAFLESTGAQYIDTKYIPNNETGLFVDHEKIVVGDSIPMGCRNSSDTQTRFFVPRSPVSAADGAGGAGYGWGWWVGLGVTFTGRQIGKLNWKNNRIAEIDTLTRNLDTLGFIPTQPLYIYAANITGQVFFYWGGRIYVAQISQGSETVRKYIPAIDAAGVPCMWDTVTMTPKYNAGTGDFIVGLTAVQARKLGNLPADAPTKTLTISLPQSAFVDVETGEIADAEVNAALAQAEANGWVITKQYYTE